MVCKKVGVAKFLEHALTLIPYLYWFHLPLALFVRPNKAQSLRKWIIFNVPIRTGFEFF